MYAMAEFHSFNFHYIKFSIEMTALLKRYKIFCPVLSVKELLF